MEDILVVVVVLLLLGGICGDDGCVGREVLPTQAPEEKLLGCLKKMSNKKTEPINKLDLQINFTLEEIRFLSFDDKRNMVTMEMIFEFKWYDYTFRWDPKEHSNITKVVISDQYIWTPTLGKLMSSDRISRIDRLFDLEVHHNGTVQWLVSTGRQITCLMDLTDYPFDRQNCSQNVAFYNPNANFRLASPQFKRIQFMSSEWTYRSSFFRASSLYPYFEFYHGNIIIDRNPKFHHYFTLAPSVLIALFILTIFWLPIQSMQRLTLCTFILMSNLLMGSIVQVQLPHSANNVPLIVRYLFFELVLLSLTYVTIIFSHILFHNHYHHGVPPIFKKIFFNPVFKHLTSSTLPSLDQSYDSSREPTNNNKKNNAVGDDDDLADVLGQLSSYLGEQVKTETDTPLFYLRNEWRQLAYVIERLAYILFLILFLSCTAAIFSVKYVSRYTRVHDEFH